ncbi:MAG: hypothetical protein J0M12_16110, partial [Deltaproteobacteria bacterium]|nr:hypothetical protein [Deltaproteobacteria bacterium]
SISLEAYKELIEKVVADPEAAKNEKYVSFLIQSIERIFTSPTEKIFQDEDSLALPTDKSLKAITGVLCELNKLKGKD